MYLPLRNLRHRPLRTGLSVLLFALGVGLVALLFLVERQVSEQFERNLAEVDLVLGAKGSPLQLVLSSMYHIDAPTGNIPLRNAKPFLNPKHPLISEALPLSVGDSYRGYRIVGTLPRALRWYDVTIADGRIWEREMEVVVGAQVARALGLELGSSFLSSHGLIEDEDLIHEDALPFVVVGIMKASGTVLDQLILTATQSVWAVHNHDEHDHHDDHDHHEHHDHSAADTLATLLDLDPEGKEITALLMRFRNRNIQTLNLQRNLNENTNLQAASPAIEITRLFYLFDTGERALRALALVIIIVSGLSIFIALYASLRERRYELALLRSFGASPGRLFSFILAEGILLALVGYALGILLCHVGMWLLGDALASAFKYQLNPLRFVAAEGWLLLASISVGATAAALPAWQAARTDVAEQLLGGSR